MDENSAPGFVAYPDHRIASGPAARASRSASEATRWPSGAAQACGARGAERVASSRSRSANHDAEIVADALRSGADPGGEGDNALKDNAL